MMQRALTGIVFLTVMLFAILWNDLSFTIVVFCIQAVCIYEFFRLLAPSFSFFKTMTHVLASSLLLLAFVMTSHGLALSFLWLFWVMIQPLKNIGSTPHFNPLAEGKLVGLAMLYFVVPFYLLLESAPVFHPSLDYDPMRFVLPLFVLVWSNDTFAYLVGKLIGKNKWMPAVSPNKTIEGLIGGLFFAAISSVILDHYINGSILSLQMIAKHLLLGICTGMAASHGDLLQSATKRYVGVKDSGKILPGHGGMWDRFDGIIPAIPIYAFLQSVLFAY